jgi:hypothetical protein
MRKDSRQNPVGETQLFETRITWRQAKRDSDFDLLSISRTCRAPVLPSYPCLKARVLGETTDPMSLSWLSAQKHTRKPAVSLKPVPTVARAELMTACTQS